MRLPSQFRDLRIHFENGLSALWKRLRSNGEGPQDLQYVNIAFLGVDGETLLMQLDLAGIAASLGSACSSGALEPSRVLIQMGIDKKTVRSSLRFSFARTNNREEVDRAIETIIPIVKKFKK